MGSNYITRNDMGGPLKISDPGHGKHGDPKLSPKDLLKAGSSSRDLSHAGKEGKPSLRGTRPSRLDGQAAPAGKPRAFPAKGKGNNGGRPLSY